VEELGGERSEQLIEHLARQIDRRKLSLPAVLFLEVTRPLSFIVSQGLFLCQPLLEFFYREPQVADYANLLADRANVDRLVARLERESSARGGDGEERGRWKRSG
jgi:hypothetical protein